MPVQPEVSPHTTSPMLATAQAQWQRLSREQRPWRRRLLLALGMGFALFFTFIIFGILDIFITNSSDFPFRLTTILLPVIGLGLACTLLYGLAVSLLRGAWFNAVLSLTLGVLVAGYLQTTVLANSLGLLTGDSIPWQTLRSQTFINLGIWMMVVSLPALLYFFFRPLWKRLIVFLPMLLVGMQLTGLIASLATTPQLLASEAIYCISTADEFVVSSQKNIFVFLLDRLDAKYIDQVRRESPDFFERLDGFTHYVDYTAEYAYTYPAIPVMLTGKQFAYNEIAHPGYLAEAWQQATFLPTLKQHGYTTKVYADSCIHQGQPELLLDQVDNMRLWQRQLNTKSALAHLVFLSSYRYCPQVLKPFFWQTPSAFSRVYDTRPGTARPYELDDERFNRAFHEKQLTVQNEKNNFTFYHLFGAHAPFSIDEYARSAGPKGSTLTAQVKGNFHIIYTFIDQLKNLGLYEDATILILGDHGEPTNDFAPQKSFKTVGLFVKQGGQANTPLRQSAAPVSQANFQATVLQEAGIDTTGYSRAFDEIGEHEDVVRRFYNYYYSGATATARPPLRSSLKFMAAPMISSTGLKLKNRSIATKHRRLCSPQTPLLKESYACLHLS